MNFREADPKSLFFRLLAIILRAGLVVALAGAAWLIYHRLPVTSTAKSASANQASVQILLQLPADLQGVRLDIPVEFSPVDIVQVRHEYYSEPRNGKRFEEFVNERKNGRTSLTTTLDKSGRGALQVPSGTWWVNAVIVGEETLEWRVKIAISGSEQTLELNTENLYTRSRSF